MSIVPIFLGAKMGTQSCHFLVIRLYKYVKKLLKGTGHCIRMI